MSFRLTTIAALLAASLGWAATARAEYYTIFKFFGIPQAFNKVRDVGSNRNGNFPGAERKDPVKRIADPENLKSDNPAIKNAAEIKKQEDLKKQKIKALKYLATVGCGCYPGVKEAVMAGMDDCTEEVRLEACRAAKAAAKSHCCGYTRKPKLAKWFPNAQRRAGGKCDCCSCSPSCCCDKEMTEKLSQIAFERDDETGCYLEPSERVREAAREALCTCCPNEGGWAEETFAPVEAQETPEEPTPEPDPVPEADKPEEGGGSEGDKPKEGEAYLESDGTPSNAFFGRGSNRSARSQPQADEKSSLKADIAAAVGVFTRNSGQPAKDSQVAARSGQSQPGASKQLASGKQPAKQSVANKPTRSTILNRATVARPAAAQNQAPKSAKNPRARLISSVTQTEAAPAKSAQKPAAKSASKPSAESTESQAQPATRSTRKHRDLPASVRVNEETKALRTSFSE